MRTHASGSGLESKTESNLNFMDTFDPYQEWLGIPSQMRPLNHYILLGVRLFENDISLINQAYDSRMALLKPKEGGPYKELSQNIIAEVGKARVELTNPEKKAIYDGHLKGQLSDSNKSGKPAGSTEQAFAEDQNEVEPALKANTVDATTQIEGGDEDEFSIFKLLSDVRVLMALITLTFVFCLVTVKLLSGGDKGPQSEQNSNQTTNSAQQTATVGLDKENQTSQGEGSEASQKSKFGAEFSSFKKVQQSAMGEFELPIRQATLIGGLKKTTDGIVNWSSRDQAAWTLVLKDRRSGFFNCKVTYRAKFESAFKVQLGAKKPLPFNVYSHKEDFEEEFIVRIDKENEQPFRLIAGELDVKPGLAVKRITLAPTR